MTKLRLSYTNLGPTPLFWAFPHADLQASAMESRGMKHSEAKRRPCIRHGSPILRKYHSPNVTYLLRNYSFVLDPFILMVHRLPVFCFSSMHGAAQERLQGILDEMQELLTEMCDYTSEEVKDTICGGKIAGFGLQRCGIWIDPTKIRDFIYITCKMGWS